MLKTNQEYLDQIKKVGEYNLKDTYKWRERALFFQEKAGKNWAEGYYTDLIEGTLDWDVFWDEEERRIMEGLWIDGFYIPGLFYFYLNYTRIIVVKDVVVDIGNGRKRKRRERVESFPYFWDYDRAYYDAIELAETHGKHLAVIKARGKGYSFKGASMLVRNYYMFRESVSYAIAALFNLLSPLRLGTPQKVGICKALIISYLSIDLP